MRGEPIGGAHARVRDERAAGLSRRRHAVDDRSDRIRQRDRFTTLALIVAVVGGLGSVPGAFLAGLLLGIVDRLSSTYIGTYVTTIVLLLCAALTVVVRPSGLLGKPEWHRAPAAARATRTTSMPSRLLAYAPIVFAAALLALVPLRYHDSAPMMRGHGGHRVRGIRRGVQRHLRQHRPVVPLHGSAGGRGWLHVGDLRRSRRPARCGRASSSASRSRR